MQSKLKQKTRLLHLLIEFNCCMVDSKLWWTPGRILLDYDWFWPGLSCFFLGFGCSIVNVFNISHYFGVRKARNRIAIEISFDLIISKNTDLLKFVLFKYAGKNVTLGFSTDLRRTKLRHCSDSLSVLATKRIKWAVTEKPITGTSPCLENGRNTSETRFHGF